MRRLRLVGGMLAATPLVLFSVATPAQAAAAPCLDTRTEVSTLTNRSDNGEGSAGTWAKLSFTRTVTICEAGPAAAEGGSNYTAEVHDEGTFVTVGAVSPQANLPMDTGVTGDYEGGFTATFVAASGFSTFVGLPTDEFDGDWSTPTDPNNPSTGNWVRVMFSSGFSGKSLDDDSWGWRYWTCTEEWVNAVAGNSGDITGAGLPCPPPVVDPDDDEEEDLPTTGVSLSAALATGVGLVLIGTMALFIGRRRRTGPASS